MDNHQADQLYENIDYIRGFKDALELILENSKVDIKEIHSKIQTHHLTNLKELFQ